MLKSYQIRSDLDQIRCFEVAQSQLRIKKTFSSLILPLPPIPLPQKPRIHSARSAAASTTRACWLASPPPTGGYERRAWRRTSTTRTTRTWTPAPPARTRTARAAPSLDFFFFFFLTLEGQRIRGKGNYFFCKWNVEIESFWSRIFQIDKEREMIHPLLI